MTKGVCSATRSGQTYQQAPGKAPDLAFLKACRVHRRKAARVQAADAAMLDADTLMLRGRRIDRLYCRAGTLPGPDAAWARSDGTKVVQYGSVVVPKTLQAEYEAVRAYMAATSLGRETLAACEHKRDALIEILPLAPGLRNAAGKELRPEAACSSIYFPGTRCAVISIVWDPRAALLVLSGGQQSPALTLAHELRHAAYVQAVPRERVFMKPHRAEERWVIQGLEHDLAVAHGEATRTSHGYIAQYAARSVCSTQPVQEEITEIVSVSRPDLKRLGAGAGTAAFRPRGTGRQRIGLRLDDMQNLVIGRLARRLRRKGLIW